MSAMSRQRFLESNTNPATVFGDKFDAGFLKHMLDFLDGALTQELTSF